MGGIYDDFLATELDIKDDKLAFSKMNTDLRRRVGILVNYFDCIM